MIAQAISELTEKRAETSRDLKLSALFVYLRHATLILGFALSRFGLPL
jgi:hypothetical protein